jgi:Golgi-resident PAP phosphatase
MNLGGSIKVNKCAVLALISLVILLLYIFTSSSSTKSMLKNEIDNNGEINLRKLLLGVILAAQEGGKEVLTISELKDFGEKSKGKTKEGVNDPVTEADKNSHCVIALGLSRIFPSLNMISEENVDSNSCPKHDKHFDLDPTVLGSNDFPADINVASSDVAVWIDPLDATKEFTEKLFHYVSVMICVAIKGTPTIGVVHFPFEKKSYWAWSDVGHSETLNDVKAVNILFLIVMI